MDLLSSLLDEGDANSYEKVINLLDDRSATLQNKVSLSPKAC